jgi:hypothetical protein
LRMLRTCQHNRRVELRKFRALEQTRLLKHYIFAAEAKERKDSGDPQTKERGRHEYHLS